MLTVGAVLGTVFALAGAALAAFLLTTAVGGQTGYADVQATASDTIKAVAGTTAGSVNCAQVRTVNRGEGIEINPIVTRLITAGEAPRVTPGSCVVTVTYANTGTIPLAAPRFLADQIPAGWSITVNDLGRAIAARETVAVKLVVTASSTAAVGRISGRLIAEEYQAAFGGPADPPPPQRTEDPTVPLPAPVKPPPTSEPRKPPVTSRPPDPAPEPRPVPVPDPPPTTEQPVEPPTTEPVPAVALAEGETVRPV